MKLKKKLRLGKRRPKPVITHKIPSWMDDYDLEVNLSAFRHLALDRKVIVTVNGKRVGEVKV